MRRVVSLFLPHLAIERLRRLERSAQLPVDVQPLCLPVDDDPGTCSVPRGGGWRPGARWARAGGSPRADVETQIAALPAHARPPMRELGRRSEAAEPPFRGRAAANAPAIRLPPPSSTSMEGAPIALIGKVGRREEIVSACPAATALGVTNGMAATHARALVSDLDFRPADPDADGALLERLARFGVRRWSPVVATTLPDGLWLDLTGCAHLH